MAEKVKIFFFFERQLAATRKLILLFNSFQFCTDTILVVYSFLQTKTSLVGTYQACRPFFLTFHPSENIY